MKVPQDTLLYFCLCVTLAILRSLLVYAPWLTGAQPNWKTVGTKNINENSHRYFLIPVSDRYFLHMNCFGVPSERRFYKLKDLELAKLSIAHCFWKQLKVYSVVFYIQ